MTQWSAAVSLDMVTGHVEAVVRRVEGKKSLEGGTCCAPEQTTMTYIIDVNPQRPDDTVPRFRKSFVREHQDNHRTHSSTAGELPGPPTAPARTGKWATRANVTSVYDLRDLEISVQSTPWIYEIFYGPLTRRRQGASPARRL